jgi:hypothetical protein
MKSPFPSTPTMRYERMAAGAMFAEVCLLLGAQFSSVFLQVAATSVAFSSMLSWAFASICFLSLGIAFSLFAACKVTLLHEPQHRASLLVIRWVGLRLLWLAFACSALWVATNLFAAVWW